MRQAPVDPGIQKITVPFARSRERARLHRRGANFDVAERTEHLAKTVNRLVEKWRQRLGRRVPAREPGATRGQNHLDLGVRNPLRDNGTELVDIVNHNLAIRDFVACLS